MSLTRNRYVHRFDTEGSEDAQRLALALAQSVPAEFLERLIAHVGALNEFGGQVYIAAVRDRFDPLTNKPVEQGGAFETKGYVLAYDSTQPKIRGQEQEANAIPVGGAEVPELPEPVEPAPDEELAEVA